MGKWPLAFANDTHSNRLLAGLPAADLARLARGLAQVALPVREMLEYPHRPIESIFFPLSGIVSIVAEVPEYQLEVGIIGREGMTGVSVLLGGDSSPHRCFVQVAGEALRISTPEFRQALAGSPALTAHFLAYARLLLLQTAGTALANGRCTIEERLARWLLMSSERLDSNDVPLTHEFLALMLGVRRPGVTIALQTLEGQKAICNLRGLITIVDRDKLKALGGGAYRLSSLFPGS